MSTGKDMSEHINALELLPLYVNGSIELEQRHQLEQHLQQCADCRDEIDLTQQIFAGLEGDEMTNDETNLALARVNARIDAEAEAETALPSEDTIGSSVRSGGWPVIDRLQGWYANIGWPGAGWAAGAAAMLVMLVVTTNLDPTQPAPYEVLSSDADGTQPNALVVEITLQQPMPLSALTAHFAMLNAGDALDAQQQSPLSYQLRFVGDISIEQVNAILQRSEALPGYAGAQLLNPNAAAKFTP